MTHKRNYLGAYGYTHFRPLLAGLRTHRRPLRRWTAAKARAQAFAVFGLHPKDPKALNPKNPFNPKPLNPK